MANIGSFKKSGQEFQGEIVTLSVQTKGVRIVPEKPTGPTTTPPATGSMSAAPRSGPPGRSAPPRAATICRSSWTIRAFNAPIYANLFDDEDGDGFTLIWSRARRPNGD